MKCGYKNARHVCVHACVWGSMYVSMSTKLAHSAPGSFNNEDVLLSVAQSHYETDSRIHV